MFIISQPGAKVRITIVQKKGAHGPRRRSPSLQEDSGTEEARTSQPAPRDKLDLRWRASASIQASEPEHASPGESETP